MRNDWIHPDREGRGQAPYALAVLVLLAVWTGFLYRQALAVGILSDGWVLLAIGRLGLRRAPFVLLSYHTIPVANFYMAVLWKLFGLHEMRYQAVNLAGVTLSGWLLYRLGCGLFGQARVALLAALLFVANSSFYEVPFWPTVGNFQGLAAVLYLSGLLALARSFRSARPGVWIALFSLCGLAAFFTYEPAISMLGVGLFYAAVVPGVDGEGATASRQRLRRSLGVLAVSFPAVAVILGSKLYTASQGYQAVFLPQDWAALKERLYLLVRGCVAIFSLSGADGKIYRVMSFGLVPPGGSRFYNALVAAWILGLAAALVLLVWRTRFPAVRLTVVWFAAHMILVAAATAIVSRHFFLGALPGCLLLSWWLWSAADRLAGWLAGRPGFAALSATREQAGALLAGIALAFLVANATSDLAVAATVHLEATAANRQVVALVRQRLAQEPGKVPRVVMVNMPAILVRDGIGAFAFVNGLREVLRLSTDGLVRPPDLRYTYASFADGKFANASEPIRLAELGEKIRDPRNQVLMFDSRTRTVTELDRASWRPPASYDAASAPYLEWQPGDWPWFRAYAGQPLELPLAVPPGDSWVVLRYLRQPGAAFTVTDATGVRLDVQTPPGTTPSWPVATFPVHAASEGVTTISLRPASEVWLADIRSFSPPADYSPESAPFLAWSLHPDAQFPLTAPALLPLAACAAPPCALRLEYFAEKGRDFALTVGAGAVQRLAFADVAAPGWRTLTVPAPGAGPVVARIEPLGAAPVLVRHLGWGHLGWE